jgi:fatty acid desaturase
MSSVTERRNYSILGPEKERAKEKGLLQAEWYQCPVPRKRLKELMNRKNGLALRDTLIWFALLFITGYLGYLSWGSWLAIPVFAVYGVVYMTPAISRWHEFSHGTPFKTQWMNEIMYQICSFMIGVQATSYRWSHSRHHTDTIIVGSDPEIVAPRPPVWRVLFLSLFRLNRLYAFFNNYILHCFGKMTPSEKDLIPVSEYRKLFWEARIYILVLLGIVGLCIYTQSILPIMFFGLPMFYGRLMNTPLVLAQHIGLHEDVLDHRLNSRTFYTNPVIRFLYTNMNYHLEHHMFPMVPYYSLPALHEEIKHDCPPATRSFPAAIKEVVVALWRQRKDPSYTLPRPLPNTERPH